MTCNRFAPTQRAAIVAFSFWRTDDYRENKKHIKTYEHPNPTLGEKEGTLFLAAGRVSETHTYIHTYTHTNKQTNKPKQTQPKQTQPKQNQPKQNQPKQNKTTQNKTKQNKQTKQTKQNKTNKQTMKQ